MKYVPPALLKQEIEDMYFEEFFDYLAIARYAQQLEKENLMRAISEVFNE